MRTTQRAPRRSLRQPVWLSLFLALGLGLVALAGCAGQAPVTPEQPSPVPSPANTRVPTPALTPVANVPIEITGQHTKTATTPRHVVRLLVSDSPAEVLVRFPGPIDGENTHPRVTQPASVSWSIQIVAPPDANTFAFNLVGDQAGFFTLEVASPGYQPVRFGVQLAESGTPEAGATPGTVSPASTPEASGSSGTPEAVVGTAVAGSGSLAGAPGSATPGLNLTSPISVTLAESGAILDLHPGDRFALVLGQGYDWTVAPADPEVLSRVTNITPVRGSQGVFEARRAGQTALAATGDPACRKSQPPCEMPSRLFQVQVKVQ